MIIFFLALFVIVMVISVVAGIINGVKQSSSYQKNRSRKSTLKAVSKATGQPNASFTITTSLTSHYVDVHQKTRGQLPSIPVSALNGYISPSGGFINYGCFDIKGKNKETNHKSSRYIEAQTEEEACRRAEENGLVGPYTVTVRPVSPPSDAQISYAHSLGADIPEGACSIDVSAIISRITDDDEWPVSENLARKAHEHGIKFSRYHGRKAIMALAQRLPSKAFSEILHC